MGALICAWMDVAAADHEAFVEFHTHEHLPERLTVPGFLRGRRFQSVEAPETLLALYEVDSLAVLTSTPYLERLNNPTDWTKRSMELIRGARRLAAVLERNMGDAGDCLLVAHLEAPSAALSESIFASADMLMAHPGVRAVRIGRADDVASNIPTTERQALGAHPHPHGLLFILEAESQAAARAAIAASPLADERLEAFQLQVSCGPTG